MTTKTNDPIWQQERTRLERCFNAAGTMFRNAVATDNVRVADRASTDLLQTIDEMLTHVGLPVLTGTEDSHDCGQLYPDALDILTEGEGEDDITEDEQNYLDGQGEL